ncbi:hypothetical protein JCM14469_25570 [Desulfatiferula olefinivorans]
MIDQSKPIEKIELTNGETLEIYDLSRKVAADTWLVAAAFRITLDVNKIKVNSPLTPTDKHIIDTLDDQLVYEVKHERNFISDQQKDTVFDDIRDSFLSTNLKYLSHPKFAVKYAVKTYHDKKKRFG